VGGKLTFFGIDYGKSVNWEMKDAKIGLVFWRNWEVFPSQSPKLELLVFYRRERRKPRIISFAYFVIFCKKPLFFFPRRRLRPLNFREENS
jgi:hypothetical protein